MAKGMIRRGARHPAGALARRIGEGKIIDDPEVLEGFAGDESDVEPRMPDLAVRAESAQDVSDTLEIAERLGIPVTPRGGGTGKAGGAIPARGGIVLDTTRMKEVVEIDREDLIAVVEPGAITGELQATLEDEGLFYPPDPNSLETCTIGGNVAHNAGGPRAFKYGVTREYVLGLETCLMGGQIVRTGKRTVKGVAGYDVTALLVGSEGTLGVFTKVTLRLRRKPTRIATMLVRLPDEMAGGRAVASVVEAGLVPRVMEMMDGVMVETLRGAGAKSVPEGTGALLLVEVDGDEEEAVETEAVKVADLCEGAGAIEVLMARHVGERNKLWAARRVLSDAVREIARFKISEDVVVPRARAVRLLEGLRRIGEAKGATVASYGHAGDGNYHVNVLWDDPEWSPSPALEAVFDLVLGLGGTITGEHGVGLAKMPYLPKEIDPALFPIYRKMKSAFDPKGLMNPGKIFA